MKRNNTALETAILRQIGYCMKIPNYRAGVFVNSFKDLRFISYTINNVVTERYLINKGIYRNKI